MSKYQLKHITKYTYPSTIKESINQIMLFPIEDDVQEVRKHEIIISHHPPIEIFTDYFSNKIGSFTLIRPIHELLIQSKLEITIHPFDLPKIHASVNAQWNEMKAIKNHMPYIDFLWIDKSIDPDGLTAVMHTLFKTEIGPLDLAMQMSSFIYSQFEYKKGITDVETHINEIWNLKAGVCQDFAHLLLAMLRHSGIPARYVSGYICPKNHEWRGEGATHAWVEAFIPSIGWIGLDPTNNCITSDRHIRLAIGRNFSDCTPVKGTYKGPSDHLLEVAVQIENESSKMDLNPTLQPIFSYQAHRLPAEPNNSYRNFVEMQQQQ